MLISGGGGGGFTQALLQGRQIGNQARALREQAHQRRQQLALGIGGLGVGAIGALGGLAGTVGNLANQSARTGILQEELGLRKAEEAPVEGSLFGLPPGPVHPRVVSLMIQKAAAEKAPFSQTINTDRITNALAAKAKAPPGTFTQEEETALEKNIVEGKPTPRLDLAEAMAKLEQDPYSGFSAGTFKPERLSGMSFGDRAKLIQQINASQAIAQADKARLGGEALQRIKSVGGTIEPPPEAFAPPPAPAPLPTTPWTPYQSPAEMNIPWERKKKEQEALRQAYLEAMYGQFPVGPQLPQ